MDDRDHSRICHTYLLSEGARRTPDRVFLKFPLDDESWTWAVAEAETNRGANLLRRLGVKRGEVVALFDEAGPDFFRLFLGALRLGAVVAPLNEAFRGNMLQHALNTCGAHILYCAPENVGRLAGLELSHLRQLIVREPAAADLAGQAGRFVIRDVLEIRNESADLPEVEPIQYWDPYAVVFTSGTTGPSKAALSPYGQIHAVLKDNYLKWLTPDDVVLSDSAMYHVSGLLTIYSALHAGCPMVRYPRFSSNDYWGRIREHGITAATLSKIEFLWNQPRSPDEGSKTLKWLLTGQFPHYVREWQARFNVPNLFTFFNMSETSSPLQTEPNPVKLRSVGRPRAGVEVRLVDNNDIEVPAGSVGELIIRTERPWEMLLCYLGNDEATANAWRNGWFHTGDTFRRDEDGDYYYVDRVKDSIRRKGENISSFEVEQEVLVHPAVLECAAVAAPSEIPGSDEVRVVVARKPGVSLTAEELCRFLVPRMPRFMLPRYIDFVEALPRNPTYKVLKANLRAAGITAATFDRDATGNPELGVSLKDLKRRSS